VDQRDESNPEDPRNLRRPWIEGPDEEALEESWLVLGDDELLHRIATLDSEEGTDEQLLEVVQSERHFFIRQEAAKQVRDHNLLFAFEDDRHIGQILVRYLTRREDVTYLERLVARSRHVEVRAAAQVQLAQLWGRLGGPTSSVAEGPKTPPPPPEFAKPAEPPRTAPAAPRTPPAEDGDGGEDEIEIEVEYEDETGMEPAAEAESAAPPESDAGAGAAPPPVRADDGVDGSLLGWAVHFLVEQVWPHLDTRAARGLLLRTHAELLPFRPALAFFRIEEDAHVHVDLTGGARLPPDTVAGVAVWMAAFLDAARASVPDLGEVDIRQSTQLMADALEQVGFYEALRDLDEV